jgi:sugar phosphate permease
VRYRWAVLAVGTAGQASFSAVLLGLPVLAPALRDEFGLSLSEAGVVLASVWVGPVFTLLAWGLLADRIGERRVLSTGLGAMGILVAAAAAAPEFWTLILLLGLASAAGASVNAASGRAVMHWFGADERGLALGLRQAALPMGGAAAALALPPIESAGGIDAAFLALGGVCICAAIAGAIALRDRPRGEGIEQAVPWTMRDNRLWLLSVASGFYLLAQVALTGFIVLFLHDARDLSIGKAAAVLALAQVLAVGLRVGAGRWSDRIHARIQPLRLVGLAIFSTVAATAALLSVPLSILLPALVLATALTMTWNGLSFTAAAELAGSARSGAALGFQQTTLSVTGVLAAPAFAKLVELTSWRAGFALSALGPLAGWALLGRLRDLAAQD